MQQKIYLLVCRTTVTSDGDNYYHVSSYWLSISTANTLTFSTLEVKYGYNFIYNSGGVRRIFFVGTPVTTEKGELLNKSFSDTKQPLTYSSGRVRS